MAQELGTDEEGGVYFYSHPWGEWVKERCVINGRKTISQKLIFLRGVTLIFIKLSIRNWLSPRIQENRQSRRTCNLVPAHQRCTRCISTGQDGTWNRSSHIWRVAHGDCGTRCLNWRQTKTKILQKHDSLRTSVNLFTPNYETHLQRTLQPEQGKR